MKAHSCSPEVLHCEACGRTLPSCTTECEFCSEEFTNDLLRNATDSKPGCLPSLFGLVAVYCLILASFSDDKIPTSLGLEYQVQPFIDDVTPWLILALVFSILAKGSRVVERKRQQRSANDAANNIELPFVLLLRPFVSDKSVTFRNPKKTWQMLWPSYHYEDEKVAVEFLLVQAVAPEFQLRVIGGSPDGPGIIYVHDAVWRDEFKKLAYCANLIVMIPLPGSEIPWELATLRELHFLEKTVLLVPSLDSHSPNLMSSIPDETFATNLRKSGFEVPSPKSSTSVYSLDAEGKTKSERVLEKLDAKSLRSALKELAPHSQIDGRPHSIYLEHGRPFRLARSIRCDGCGRPLPCEIAVCEICSAELGSTPQ